MKRFVLMIITALICGMVFTSCSDKISDEARNYLNEVLDIMEKNSINRYEINWADFRKKVFKTVPEAQTIDDTYPGIKKALTLLGDHHSFFMRPNGSRFWGSYSGTGTYQKEEIWTPAIPNDVGYVTVSTHNLQFPNEALSKAFANEIQNQIKRQDHLRLKGWIVDLRNNGGGNMYPMLAGIGPILGEGVAGYFITPDRREISWGFQNGNAVYNNDPLKLLSDSYKLLVSNPKVAVLLNFAIASSGEAIAVSFIGRENTKSFGSATYGLTTGNQGFRLSDNAILYLTTVYFADRNKKTYGGGPINPDVISSSATIINDALAWIRE